MPCNMVVQSKTCMHTTASVSPLGLCLLCSKICLLAFLRFFAYYTHFYASQIQVMLTILQITVIIDQEEPLFDYNSFLIGKPLIKNRKLSKLCQKFYLLCWHNALCFPIPIILKIMPE